MVVRLKSMVNIFQAEIAQLQAANALLDIILVFLPGVGIVIEALVAACEFILTIGADVIAAAFTDDQWQIVFCTLYCSIASDGTVDQARFDAILDTLHTDASTVVYDVLYTLFTLSLGVNGLSNAGATGDAVGDCTGCSCAWHYRWNFLVSDGDFVAFTGAGDPGGNWVSGQGWRAVSLGHGTGTCTTVWSGALATAPLDIPGDCTIDEMSISGVDENGVEHVELWIGANRTEGLTRPEHIYQANYPGDVTGSIGAASAQLVSFLMSGCDDPGATTQIDLVGHGTPPAFTGGEFV